MKQKFIIFTGLTCAGKDTCQRILMEKFEYSPIISTTSRPIRPSEVNGVNYYFVTKEEFESKLDTFLEYRKYNTLVDNNPEVWYYGIENDKILDTVKKYVVVLDNVGYDALKEKYGDAVTMIWVDTPYLRRKHRCIKRGDFNKYEFPRRNKSDKERFVELPKLADYKVRNIFTKKYLEWQLTRIIKRIEHNEK